MENVTSESKRLAVQLNEKADQYVTGELDLTLTLEKTDQLFQQILSESQLNEQCMNASVLLYDSNLMKTQTRLAKQRARYYKPDSLVFNPAEFANKLAEYLGSSDTQQSSSASQRMDELLWMRMGNEAKKMLYTVPSFNFIYGTFDPAPVQVVKKKRKMREKDKIGELTKPHSMSLADSTDTSDQMIEAAGIVLSVFHRLCKKTEGNIVCYFEFVMDPTSFSRTVENIFIVSLLVKEGCIKIIKDKNGLPCLTQVTDNEKKERNPAAVKQCLSTITKKEWQDIVRTFKFKTPLIPPRKPTYSQS